MIPFAGYDPFQMPSSLLSPVFVFVNDIQCERVATLNCNIWCTSPFFAILNTLVKYQGPFILH